MKEIGRYSAAVIVSDGCMLPAIDRGDNQRHLAWTASPCMDAPGAEDPSGIRPPSKGWVSRHHVTTSACWWWCGSGGSTGPIPVPGGLSLATGRPVDHTAAKTFRSWAPDGGRPARCLHILANMDIYQPSTSNNSGTSSAELAINWENFGIPNCHFTVVAFFAIFFLYLYILYKEENFQVIFTIL